MSGDQGPGKSLGDRVLEHAGPRVKSRVSSPEQREALDSCLVEGLEAFLLALGEGRSASEREQLGEILDQDDFARELARLLRGDPLSAEDLGFFVDPECAEPAAIPGLEAAVVALEAAFYRAVEAEPALEVLGLQMPERAAGPSDELVERVLRLVGGEVAADSIWARKVIGTQVNVFQATAPPSEPSADAPLRESYLHRVLEESGALALAGVDPAVAMKKDDAALKLEAVYTALLTKVPEDRAAPGPEGMREHRLSSALEQLDRHDRLVLLGEPGSGKSTFLNHVALCLAGDLLGSPRANRQALTAPLPDGEGQDQKKRQRWSHGALLPVRVVLRDFAAAGLQAAGEVAEASHLWSFIEGGLAAAELGDYAPALKRELQGEGGLILLDGLDEVPEAEGRRKQILEAVADFAATFGKCRFLVTCRTYAYQEQRWRLGGFEVAELAPLADGQVKRFVDRWYGYVGALRKMDADDAQGRAELLKRAIFGSDRLRELASRPLLLTLMSSLHAWRGGSLPEKREELYSDAVDLMLYFWEEKRVVKRRTGAALVEPESLTEFLKVGRDAVRRQLEELAFEAHASQPSLVGTADVAEERLVASLLSLAGSKDARPGRLLEYLRDRAGLLAERGVGIYTFPHRTIQEYLAACYLTDRDFPDQVAALARGDSERWREVVLLAGAKAARGSAAAAWLLADALCFEEPEEAPERAEEAQGARLAGLLLSESGDLERVSERHRRTLDRVRRWQVRLLEGEALPARERVECGRSAAVLGDLRDSVTRLDEMEFCWVPGGPFWMGDDGGLDREKPQHLNEHLSYDYWLARYPVTVAQYGEYLSRSGREAGHAGALAGAGNKPVVLVSWEEGMRFCEWLTESWREKGLLSDGLVVRLPSEAEWEKGARGGLEVPRGRIVRAIDECPWREDAVQPGLVENSACRRQWPWGENFDKERCNSLEGGLSGVSSVGCYGQGRSPYGCEELSGNVWEWTRSRWGEDWGKPEFGYPYEPSDGREAMNREIAKTLWVLRGGAFSSYHNYVRCSARYRLDPGYRNHYIGFRVALSPI